MRGDNRGEKERRREKHDLGRETTENRRRGYMRGMFPLGHSAGCTGELSTVTVLSVDEEPEHQGQDGAGGHHRHRHPQVGARRGARPHTGAPGDPGSHHHTGRY